MAKRYFTTNKAGEEVEVSRDLALELINVGKKEIGDFEIEEDVEEISPVEAEGIEVETELTATISPSAFPEELKTPLQEAEKQFEAEIAPMQQIEKEGRIEAAKERKKRRKAGKLTIGEKIEDIALTRDVTESIEPTGPMAEATGLLSLPARALGSLIGMGDITEESTKLLKPAIESVNEWASEPENQGKLDQAAALVANMALEIGSDPTAIATGGARNIFRRALKKAGKTVTKKQADDFIVNLEKKANEKIQKAAKKAGAGDVEAEKALVEAGGGEQVVGRLKSEGIDITTEGVREIPQEKVGSVIKKLEGTPIEEFDITDAIEATVIPIDKKDFVIEALRGNVTKHTNLPKLVDDIIFAGDNPAEVKKLLRDAGFDNPNKVAGVFNSIDGPITGVQARDLITELNRATKGKNVTANQRAMNKVKSAIEGRLKKAVGETIPDDAIEDYINLREIGTGKFALKKGKLSNIIKRKGDKTLDEKASINALNKMISEAIEEVRIGKPGKSFENLKEIDQISGSNISEITRDIALADRFSLGLTGEIGAVPGTIKASKKQPIIESSIVGGPTGAKLAAARNIGSEIINKSNRKQIVKLVNTISKQRKKLDLSKQRIAEIKKDIDAGKKFLMSELEKGRSLQFFDAVVAAGVVTVRELIERLGEDEANRLIEEAKNSSNNRVRALGQKMKKEL